MNCSLEFVHSSFQHEPPPSNFHLILPYIVFAASSFFMLFGSYALQLVALANSAAVYVIGVNAVMAFASLRAEREAANAALRHAVASAQAELLGRECISLTLSIAAVSLVAFIVSLLTMRYFRRGFFTGLSLAITSYNILRPIPLPAAGSLVIMNLPLVTGWSIVLVSLMLGFLIRGNVVRAGRLICAAHGANGVCSTFPILVRTSLATEIEIWQASILYVALFALSFFTQHVPKTAPAARPVVDYGLYI